MVPCEEACCEADEDEGFTPGFKQCNDLYAEGFECPATFTPAPGGMRCEKAKDGDAAAPCEEACCIAPPVFKQCGEVFNIEGLVCAPGLIPAADAVRCETRSGTAGDTCDDVCCQASSGMTCSEFLDEEFGSTCAGQEFFVPDADMANVEVPENAVNDLAWQYCCKPVGKTCEDLLGSCPNEADRELFYTPSEAFDNDEVVPKEYLLNTPEVVNFCCEPENGDDPFVWLCDGGAGRQRGLEVNKDESNIVGSLQDCKDQCESDGCGLLEFNRDTGRCMTFMGWNASPDKCGSAPNLQTWFNPATALGDE